VINTSMTTAITDVWTSKKYNRLTQLQLGFLLLKVTTLGIRRRRYFLDWNCNHNGDNNRTFYTCRAMLPENPEVNYAGHPNTVHTGLQCLDYHKKS